ncbi:MAG: hypothetical protein IKK36_07740 [Bacteroidales bacterium]|nr:hypothetical protein [Bacteroidales bacterium]
MAMIPRVDSSIHIKGEAKDVYHLVVNVNLENNTASYIENNDSIFSQSHPNVSFDDIDDIKY